MTPDTVFLNTSGAILGDEHASAICVEGEGHGMVVSITGFRCVFVDVVVHRQMAVNTHGPFGVRAMLPGRIETLHDVTIDASRGVAREIGGCF